MALIAPGAFLWLTFFIQATTGTTAPAMWLGIFGALLLCLWPPAVAYAEISKLYPGTGSSYYYASKALLSKDKMFPSTPVWPSSSSAGAQHLYYWVVSGVMVATTGIFMGMLSAPLSQRHERFQSRTAVHGSGAIAFSFLRRVDCLQGAGAQPPSIWLSNVIRSLR